MTLIEQLLVAMVPVVLVTVGTAIYLNRRRSDRLYQRLFGLDDDPEDEGYIPMISEQVEDIDKNVTELNHTRIDTIEEQLNNVHSRIDELNKRMAEQEDEED